MRALRTPASTLSIHAVGVASILLLAGCAGGSGPADAGPGVVNEASEAEWRSLATPRPEPLPDAARISVSELEILADDPWGMQGPVPISLGITELVTAGLLRRADVFFVERRRFAAAAEAERRGQPRPRGAPAAGVSAGPEFILSGSWATLGLDSAYLELRLTDAESGGMVTGWRTATANDADPTALARAVVGSLLTTLDEMGRLPAWSDPAGQVAPPVFRPSGVGVTAVQAFLDGLAAEERWRWDEARRGYQTALARGGDDFVEAAAALARTARLRNGGTLGVSQQE